MRGAALSLNGTLAGHPWANLTLLNNSAGARTTHAHISIHAHSTCRTRRSRPGPPLRPTAQQLARIVRRTWRAGRRIRSHSLLFPPASTGHGPLTEQKHYPLSLLCLGLHRRRRRRRRRAQAMPAERSSPALQAARSALHPAPASAAAAAACWPETSPPTTAASSPARLPQWC